MNREVKAMWLDALRSGEYLQGTGALRRKVSGKEYFCCLGVLMDLAEKQGLCEYSQHDSGYIVEREDGSGKWFENSVLAAKVAHWAGLRIMDPSVLTEDGFQNGLAELNDNGMTFEKIANCIEKQL